MIKVTLELSERGARVLMAVVGSVTGNDNGPRGVTTALYEAIRKEMGSNTAYNSLVKSGQINLVDTWPIQNSDIDVKVDRL